MRIALQSWGSEGDLRPAVTLANGLAEAGHDTSISLTDVTCANEWTSLISDRVSIISPPSPLLTPDLFRRAGAQIARGARTPEHQIRIVFQNLLFPIAQQLFDTANELCRANDAVIGHFLLYPMAAAATLSGRPRVSLFTAPLIPSREYVTAGVPNLGRWSRLLAWRLVELVMGYHCGRGPRSLYRRAGLPAPRRLIRDVWMSQCANLLAVSPELFPKPADWDHRVDVCGTLTLPAQESVALPEEVEAFLRSGPSPVYVSFGSMLGGDPDSEDLSRTLLAAIRTVGCRAILQGEGLVGPGQELPPGVLVVDRLPHTAIFPRCAAVIHHGGSGTSQTAARCGCPSVVVAYIVDQFFWGRLLFERGVAPRPLRRVSLSVKSLRAALDKALSSPSMRQHARALGESMRRERSIDNAVDAVERAWHRHTRLSSTNVH